MEISADEISFGNCSIPYDGRLIYGNLNQISSFRCAVYISESHSIWIVNEGRPDIKTSRTQQLQQQKFDLCAIPRQISYDDVRKMQFVQDFDKLLLAK